jgi:hypothetical protein
VHGPVELHAAARRGLGLDPSGSDRPEYGQRRREGLEPSEDPKAPNVFNHSAASTAATATERAARSVRTLTSRTTCERVVRPGADDRNRGRKRPRLGGRVGLPLIVSDDRRAWSDRTPRVRLTSCQCTGCNASRRVALLLFPNPCGQREGPPERAFRGSRTARLAVVYPASTATPAGPEAPVMKLWLAPVPSRFARPIVPVSVPALLQ